MLRPGRSQRSPNARSAEALPRPGAGVFRWLRTAPALAATVVGLCLIGGFWAWRHGVEGSSQGPEGYTPGHAALLVAWGEDLPFEPRPWGSVTSAREPEPFETAPVPAFAGGAVGRRVLAEARIDRELTAEPSAEILAASGVRHLVRGAGDEAVAELEAARRMSPSDPRIVNDLAAAYLVRSAEQDRSLDLLAGLRILLAEELEGFARPEAMFNRALALQALGLREAALEQWERFLSVAPKASTLVPEVRARVATLGREPAYRRWEAERSNLWRRAAGGDGAGVRALVEEFPEQVLEEVETWLLHEWSRAATGGRGDADHQVLSAVRVAAQALGPEAGGRPLERTVRQVEATPPAGRKVLAEALGALASGREAVERLDLPGAQESLDRSLTLLADAESAYLPRARLLLAKCKYHALDYREVIELLQQVRAEADRVGDVTAVIESAQLRGVVETVANRFVAALESYRSALTLTRELGWEGRSAATEGLIGEALGFLGDDEGAWRHRLRASRRADRIGKARIRVRLWSDLTRAARHYGASVGRPFADALVAEAAEADLPETWIVALRERAGSRAATGDLDGALIDLDGADAWLGQLQEHSVAEAFRAESLLARSEMLASEDPAQALRLVEEGSDILRRTGHRARMPRALRIRGHHLRRGGDLDGARRDLADAARILEQRVAHASEPRQRWSGADEIRAVYEELVALETDRGRWARAFALAERARRPGRPRPSGEEPLAFSARDRSPPGVVVLSFFTLPDRLLVWRLGADRLTWAEVPVGRRELDSLVSDFVEALQGGRDFQPAAERLHRLLLADLRSAAAGAEVLAVVPDGALARLPFAALVDPATGRFLIEDRVVVTSPSAAGALRALASTGREPLSPATRVLAVADAAVTFPSGLPRLPGALREVRRIHSLFPRASVLAGEEASETAVRAGVADREILHFAGHALANARQPYLSSLPLVPGQGEDGLWFRHEVAATDLSGTRLVVLSACGPGALAAGGLHLAEGFLDAGAPAVVASLWELDDAPTSRFFERFYSELRKGVDVSKALRRTQLGVLSSEDPTFAAPGIWAAYSAIQWSRQSRPPTD